MRQSSKEKLNPLQTAFLEGLTNGLPASAGISADEKGETDSGNAAGESGLRRNFGKIPLYQLLLVLGILILLYPLVAHFYRSYKMNHLVVEFNEQQLQDEAEREALAEQVTAYQKSLSDFNFLADLQDPFVQHDNVTMMAPEGEVIQSGKMEMTTAEAVRSDEEEPVSSDPSRQPEVIATLEIPKLKENIPVYNSISDDVLRIGAGLMSGSSLPYGGIGTNCVLTGHRGTYEADLFRNINQLTVGDYVLIHNRLETLGYRVLKQEIVEPYELGKIVLDPEKDLLTLVTCHPYLINSHRLLLTCERDPDYVVPAEAAKDSSQSIGSNLWESVSGFAKDIFKGIINPYYVITSILLLVLIVLLLVKYFRKWRKQGTRKHWPPQIS